MKNINFYSLLRIKKSIATCVLSFLMFFYCFAAIAQSNIISTIAGNGISGYSGDDSAANSAKMAMPCDISFDAIGNMYIADYSNNVIRKVNPDGIISTFAGCGIAGFSGDGGPATAAKLHLPIGTAVDALGNVYIVDNYNCRIRKVNPAGIISTIAGNGTATFGGDGGPATAAFLNWPDAIACDFTGNVFIADAGNNRIRKVNATGIISTVAGNGIAGFSGDGSVATSAEINTPLGVAFDRIGNLYIADNNNHRVRKVNTVGIISTVAGSGSGTYSGDGGPATAAGIVSLGGLDIDAFGDIYIADYVGNNVRKVNTLGNISTFAGTGTSGFSGDGGLATNAKFATAADIAFDAIGNVYVADRDNNRIRKILISPTFLSDSFAVYISKDCGGLQFEVTTNLFHSGQHIVTKIEGDLKIDSPISSLGSGFGSVMFFQPINTSGTYLIKQILYNGILAVDSITYNYDFIPCQVLAIDFFYDANGNCIKDSSEPFLNLPITAEVDSNGVAIDTISATSGFYFAAYGSIGDIYTFKILTVPSGLYVTCPTTLAISDTLFEGTNSTKYFALMCTSGSSVFDLAENVFSISGRHMQTTDMVISNAFCPPVAGTLTFNFSNKYNYESSDPSPTTVVGNVATWNFSAISSITAPPHIHVTLAVPGTWLTIGDTVISKFHVTPYSGDIDTINNYCEIIDTVKSSYDPNDMTVIPNNCIPSSSESATTELHYSIGFENTGNDTAHNIFILDTLSNNLNPHTLRIVATSAVMFISQFVAGGYNIVKFEFPNINLLDSSHHNQCYGMINFKISTKGGLADGTQFYNKAGIYFDENPVVLTNSVRNTVGCGTLGISKAQHDYSVFLSPNPAKNELILKLDNINEFTSFTITNCVGAIIQTETISQNLMNVNIENLATGIYYLYLKGVNGTKVEKFVKL